MKLLLLLLTLSFQVHAQLPPQGLNDTVGIQFKPNDDNANKGWDIVAPMGFKFVRRGFYWSSVEKSKGTYDFSYYDKFMAEAKARGMRVSATLYGDNALYQTTTQPRSLITDPGRRAFAKFAAALAARYKDNDVVWELWNEPNLKSFWGQPSNTNVAADEYTAFAKVVVPAIKGADPSAFVVVGSISALWTDSFKWFQRCLDQGILASGMDGLSVHPYGFRWPELAALEGYARLRTMLKAKGREDLPIVTSEVGYDIKWIMGRGYTEDEARVVQGAMLIRQQLIDLMSNLRYSIWYEFRENEIWGLVNTKFEPFPAYDIAKLFLARMKGYRFVKRLPLAAPEDYALLFENANKDQQVVAWTAPKKSVSSREVAHVVALELAGLKLASITDMKGAAVKLTSENALELDEYPKYLTYEKIVVTPPPVTGLSNVALKKTVVTSSNPETASKLTDGDLSTNGRWFSSSGYPQVIEIDLAGDFSISEVRYSQFTNRTQEFKVEALVGGAWREIGGGSNAALDVVASFSAVVASKIRFTITKGSLYQKGVELKVMGTKASVSELKNLALNRPITASSGQDSADNLNDGDVSTTNSRWFSSSAYPQVIEVDLGGNYEVSRTRYLQFTQRTSDYTIEVLTANGWKAVKTVTGNTIQKTTDDFAPVVGNRVRFTITKGSLYQKAYEFEVYGR